MANHKSAEKRARQTIAKTERNKAVRSRARTAVRLVTDAKTGEEAKKALGGAYKAIQKAKKVLHKNTMRRRMSRTAKSANRKAS